MTTYMYTTTSNCADVSDIAEVRELVESEDYWFTVEPSLDENSDGTGAISFYADAKPQGAFDIHPEPDAYDSVAEEFFEELSQYLEVELEVKCVEVEGVGEVTAWKWIVSPDGTIQNINF